MKIYITALFLVIFHTSVAQSDSIVNIIDSLEKKNITTLIHYYIKCQAPLFGNFNEFLIWNQNSSTKLIIYTSNRDEEKKDSYIVREIRNDSIFSYLNNHFDTIKKERIYPFIYKEQMAGTSVYLPIEYTHPCNIRIYIKYNGVTFYTENSTVDLEETIFGEPKNVNYKFNSSTHLFYLIKLVQKEAH